MANLYTSAQVDNALLRAQVAMYLISEQIQDSFYYFNAPLYNNYKELQYDIYTLYTVILAEKEFVTYNPVATLYEDDFYMLVGSMINKVKQVDVFGAFGGTVNPNYQNPAGVIDIIVEGGVNVQNYTYNESDLIDAGGENYYLPFINPETDAPLYNKTPLLLVSDEIQINFQLDETTIPARLYGFANNDAQTITLTVI